MDRKTVAIFGAVFLGIVVALGGFLVFVLFMFRGGSSSSDGIFGGGPAIGVVEISGEIVDADTPLKNIRRFVKNDDIKALLVRLNTPGGTVGASQEIYSELKKAAQSKPVVCSMGDVAASGGYYIAAGCQKVVANPGTLTGSIGVITRLPYLGDIARSLKFDMVVIKSGKMKDAGDPFREMTNEENHYWQSLIDSIHQQFVSAVAEGRRLPIDEVKPFADGRILTGEAAKNLKLVDELGNFYDAVRLAATLARIEKEPRLQYPPEESPFRLERLFRASGRAAVKGVKEEIFSSTGLPTKTLGPSYLMSFPNN